MINWIYGFLGFIVLGILVSVIWRLASQRQSLPCPVWLRWMVEMDNPFTESNRAAVIIGYLGVEPGMKVLDFGCGPGRLTIPLAEKVGPQGEVVAIDIQPGMLSRTQEKAREAKLENIRFVQAAAGNGKLGSNQFDRAVLVTVLGEIPDGVAALKELFEAIKPCGILSVTEVIFDPHFQTRETVLRYAQAAGFREKGFFGKKLAYTMHLEKPG
jgi:ubiquinone/menaquinone biosynthesis C-methylase UbiE